MSRYEVVFVVRVAILYRSRTDRLGAVTLAALGAFLQDRGRLRAALRTHGVFEGELDRYVAGGGDASDRLANIPPRKREALFAALFMPIEVSPDALTMLIRTIELKRFLEWDGQGAFLGRPADWPTSTARYAIDVPGELDLAGLARRFGHSPGYFSRLIRLNYLAPDIIAAIADGTRPSGLDRKTLASAHIPLD